jgi:DNA-binding MarR family transcriptional regulator
MSCENENHLVRLIYITAQAISRTAEKHLSPHGLTVEQLHLLKQVKLEPGISQRRLGELTNKTPANVTRILDRLEDKGLVSRNADPNDRRTSLVVLLAAGEQLMDRVHLILEQLSDRLLSGIGEQAQEQVRQVLQTITTNIETIDDEPGKSTT